MPRIASVAGCVAVVPLEKVTSFSTRTVRERHYGLVKIRSAEGIEGVGYSYAGNRAGHLLAITIADLLAPKLIGEDSLRVEGLWEDLYQEAILQGRAGVVMRGLSALDMALWDLNARSAGLPLYQYLGAFEWDSVPAYASGGYYLDGKSPRLLGKEMEAFAKQGYAAVKMKVGRLSPAEEQRRVRAARQAIGPEIQLMLDANNAWGDLPTALRYMDRFEPYEPFWIEEPFSPDDIDTHARLAARISTSVAMGEIEAGRWRFKENPRERGSRHPPDGRHRMRRRDGVASYHGHRRELRRQRLTPRLARHPRAPRGQRPERPLRGIHARRSDRELPPPHRPAGGIPQGPAPAAQDPRPRIQL